MLSITFSDLLKVFLVYLFIKILISKLWECKITMSASGWGDIWIYINNFMLPVRNSSIANNKEKESGFCETLLFYSDWKPADYWNKVKKCFLDS